MGALPQALCTLASSCRWGKQQAVQQTGACKSEQQSLAEQPAAKLCKPGISGYAIWDLQSCRACMVPLQGLRPAGQHEDITAVTMQLARSPCS